MRTLPSIALELTPRCNQQCVYCYNAWRGRDEPAGDELTLDQIRTLLDRVLAEAELDHITLTGGEPFLREDILEIIDAANARGLSAAIISNGGAVQPDTARALAGRDVAYVQMTLTGADATAHDALCGAGSFARIARAAGLLDGAGIPLGGSYLCTKANARTAGGVLNHMEAIGLRQHIAFNRFNPSGHAGAHMADLMPTRSDVLEALGQADAFAAERDMTIHCTMPIPLCMVEEDRFPHIGFGQCSAGSDYGECAVDSRGNLKLCALQRESIGNLFEAGLGELLDAGGPERFRSAVPAFCAECPHQETCLGGCGAAAEWVFGRPDALDPFLAQHVPADLARPEGRLEPTDGP